MNWKDEKRLVKLMIMSPRPKDSNNLTVVFAVTETQKSEFETMLTNYLKFVEQQDGVIHVTEEILDADTNHFCAMSISISGLNQGAFARELQVRARQFPIQ